MNSTEYHNQNDSWGVQQNSIVRDYNNKNECNGAFQLTKNLIAVETNTTREYHNQKDCSGVLQTKVLPGSVKKGLPENITDISKVLSESTTIKVSQGSITIQSTARKFHKQKYFQ